MKAKGHTKLWSLCILFSCVFVILYLVWPRLKAEYYYARISRGAGEVEWFDELTSLGEPAVPVLVRLLRDADALDREFAARRLGKLRDKRAVPPLMELASSDPDMSVRIAALSTLGTIGDPRALPLLREAATETRPSPLEQAAMLALVRLPSVGKQAVTEIAGNKESPFLRAAAGIALCREVRRSDRVAWEVIGRLLNDSDAGVRAEMVQAIASSQGQRAERLLLERLTDEDVRVRLAVAMELGKLGNKSGYETALQVVREGRYPEALRNQAVLALGFIGDQRAASELSQIIDSRGSPLSKEMARRAMAVLFPYGRPKEN